VSAGGVLRRVGMVLGLPVVLIAVWWFTSANSENFYFPPLADVVSAGREEWVGERLTDDILPSVLRLLTGYLLAVVIGVLLGVLIGSFRTVRAIFEPVLEFLRALPPPVLVPIIILFMGLGTAMKVLVIVAGCVWPILLNTVEGVRAVDEVQSDTARSYGISGLARQRHLVLPAAGPQIFAGMRQALSIAIILMVISELFASEDGLGYTIVEFQRTFAIPEMWSGVIVLGLLGVLLSLVFRSVENHVLRWYHGLRQAQRSA
jgi:ABC-type nitrate/sulfonate/bicarbonate transport system permease component